MAKLLSRVREQLWKDPDWTCPRCGFVNMAIRSACRNFACTFRWEDDLQALVIDATGQGVPVTDVEQLQYRGDGKP